jgi:transposase InsO family protein
VCSSICSPFSPFYCATAWRDATEGEAAHDISRPGTISTLKGKDPEVSPRILRTYDRLNQKTAIQFVDYVLERLPFQVQVIQTDNGSEFGSQFHYHVLDKGVGHRYIRPRTPRLNGKVERSHRIDAEEFYRLLDGAVIDDAKVFNNKLREWEDYYNVRPCGIVMCSPQELHL